MILYLFARLNLLVMNTPAVEHYHTLTPLTAVNQQQNQTWHGYSSTTYKAVSTKDGRTYCLRRIHGQYLSTEEGKRSIADTYTT